MCDGRELDRSMRRDDEAALEEIRQLFARYRQVARHGMVTERDEPAEDSQPEPALAERVRNAVHVNR
jgi:hypothetical protein